MTRIVLVALMLAATGGWAQGKNPSQQFPPGMMPPDHDPTKQGTEEDKCQAVCGQAMQKCMMPCLNGDPEEAAKPENRNKTMACVKKCGDQQEPCMKGCEKKKKQP